MLSSKYEFRDKRHREGCAFLMGKMKLHFHMYRDTTWQSESKERLVMSFYYVT